MSINVLYNKKNNVDKAKLLDKNVKLQPDNTMVIFNLRGTLIRHGILLRKTLKYITSDAVDQAIGKNQEMIRIPLVHNISNNLELLALENKKDKINLIDIFEFKKVHKICEKALLNYHKLDIDNYNKIKDTSHNISQSIYHNIQDNLDSQKLLKLALEIYEQQISKHRKPSITPEITQLITNLADIGVPVAIVSNATQEIVDDYYAIIHDALPEKIQQKSRNKEWFFTKVGIQRDNDGDIILPGKPAPDLLSLSLRKVNKYNNINQKNPIQNIIFVGNSEAYDMRAADNLQKFNNNTDNNISVYKLLNTHDNPEKIIRDDAYIKTKSVMKNVEAINERLISSFERK